MPTVITRIIQDFSQGDKDHHICQQTPNEMAELVRLASTVQNGLIVEIGRRFGGSMVLMALASPTSKIISIDAKSTYLNRATKLAKKYNVLERCSFITSQSQVLHEWDKDIDLLFIDGNHGFSAVFNDLQLWVPRIKPGGLVIMHDIGQNLKCPGIQTCTKAKIQYCNSHSDILYDQNHVHTLWSTRISKSIGENSGS